MRTLHYYLLIIFLSTACQSPDPISPEARAALPGFVLMDGFRIEAFASEPLVADPVAMEIDEDGRIYVVEMHGYPLDVAGSGKVKILEDTNADGLPDKATLFAEGLILPTGITRWKKGVIVTDAPDVWYLEDSNGDGKADIKEKMLTGFARSNPQHNLNSPVFGLDNWIYLAHEGTVSTKFFPDKFGGEGDEIIFPDKPEVRLPRNADGRNVRFRPDTYQLEAMSGESQFVMAFDAWGHQILNSNAHHLFHEVIAARYLQRNPHLAIPDATAYMPTYGQGVEVFPVTKNPEHQLLTDVGTITSACGVSWYQGDLFPEPFRQVTFVAEPVHNLVHADVISERGATFAADRLLENSEFLASEDSWFRPVNFYVGPDGALYVIDYYRQIVEHPEWMSEEVNNSGQLYNGTDMGRIYRIVPETAPALSSTEEINMGTADAAALVEKLAHPNLWWRRHAQRLLLDREATEVAGQLQEMAVSHSAAVGRVHALWTLQGLGLMDEATLRQALQDEEAGVRENAIRIAELHLEAQPGLREALYPLAEDQNAKVRFQLICTLGGLDEPQAREIVWSVLRRDVADEWVQYAALSAADGIETQWLQQAVSELTTADAAPFFRKLAGVISRSDNTEAIEQLISLASSHHVSQPYDWKAAALRGLADGLAARQEALPGQQQYQQKLLALFRPDTPAPLRRAGMDLLAAIGLPEGRLLQPSISLAARALDDRKADPEWRTDAIQLLATAAPEDYSSQLSAVIQPQEAVAVQKAAIRSLGKSQDIASCTFVLDQWPSLTPELRDEAINIFGSSEARMLLLLDAVEQEQVDPSTIGWRRSVRLMNHNFASVRNKARQLLASGKPNEAAVVQAYQPALSLGGDALAGKTVFEQSCARCHAYAGRTYAGRAYAARTFADDGTAIGPDLSTVRNRSKNAIMEDILMPNKSIADGYELWEVTLNNGRTMSGIISTESVSALTLTDLGGNTSSIQRSDIQQLHASEYSAMPSGLEAQIDHQQMADLLEFLKAPPSGLAQSARR
jgi:putative membrane-bound dehydrogenase-like protein